VFRLSPSVRCFVVAAALGPAVAFTARGAQAPPETQAPSGGAASQVIVPFEHNARQNAILIRATINQRAALLLLDTGARNSVISREIAGMANEDLRGGFSGGGPGFKGEALTMRATVKLGGETSRRGHEPRLFSAHVRRTDRWLARGRSPVHVQTGDFRLPEQADRLHPAHADAVSGYGFERISPATA
jgi:hypothetical protein